MAVADTLRQLPPLFNFLIMTLEIIERSIMLGYVLGYCSSSNTYVIFSPWLSDEVAKVINSTLEYYPKACITFLSDEDKAKEISHTPQWLTALSELGIELNEY